MKNKIKFTIMSILVLIVLIACKDAGLGPSLGGTMTIRLTDSTTARTLTPSIDMDIATYNVSGVGPGGATFDLGNTADTTVTASDLATGEWTVTVQGINTNSDIVGEGVSTVTVLASQAVDANIVIIPLVGQGNLTLSANWATANDQITAPGIVSTLTPPSDPVVNLPFIIAGTNDSANYTGDFDNGYYTLILKLVDGADTVAGAVEIVRVAANATTTGSYTFDDINTTSPGSIQVLISQNMMNPIDLEILPVMNGGGGTERILDTNMGGTTGTPASVTLVVGAPAETENLIYVWYLNGETTTTGDTITIDSMDYYDPVTDDALVNNTYLHYCRFDVTAFTTDGTRAGSESYIIKIRK